MVEWVLLENGRLAVNATPEANWADVSGMYHCLSLHSAQSLEDMRPHGSL